MGRSRRRIAKKSFRESLLTDYVREIVYGASDGVVTTFAVIAGFSGANQSPEVALLGTSLVVLVGFSGLIADAFSMGLGDFLSSSAEWDVYQSLMGREKSRLEESPQEVTQETHQKLLERGFQHEDADTVLTIFKKNHRFWLEWILHEHYGVTDPGESKPWLEAVLTGVSFISFGAIPLLIFWWYRSDPTLAFQATIVGVIACWSLIGFLRWRAVGNGFLKAFGETLLLGSLSATIAYLVGTLLS